MSLQDWGSIGELIGGIAVIFTLIYLAIQVRHSTNATKGSAYQQYRAQYHHVLEMFNDSEARRIYRAGRDSTSVLDENEQAIFARLVTLMVNNYETLFYLQQLKIVDAQMVSEEPLVAVFRHEGVKQWWLQGGSKLYPLEFRDFVENRFLLSETLDKSI